MHFIKNHSLFEEVGLSCANELRKKGVDAEVWLTRGGVGIKFLSSIVEKIEFLSELPIREVDFTQVSFPPIEILKNLDLYAIGIPGSADFTFSCLKIFPLESLLAESVKATDFSTLSNSEISKLSLGRTSLKDLEFCRLLPLELLQIDHCKVDDLSALKGKKLFHLNIFKCEVSDLSALNGMPLHSLDICSNKISDLSPLLDSSISNLEMRATQVSDLQPLSSLPIETLSLPGSPVSNLGHLVGCPIKDLNIIGLEVDDLGCIKHLPLRRLHVSPGKLNLKDFEFLKSLDLEYLIGPGDEREQKPQEFFDKYESH